MSHYAERLEKDLSDIRDRVLRLSTQVGQALENAQNALLSGDEAIAYATVLGDHYINRTSREIDRACHAFIARHLPSAGHLRLMSSIIRVNVALERIGDYAVTICRESVQLSSPPHGNLAKELHSLSEEARRLLGESIEAFNQGNAEQARTMMALPERIENMMDGIYSELIDQSNAREPRNMVADFVIFSLLKRVTDQAKNICDQTVFAVEGEIKGPKVFHILFIDEENSHNSQMAEAITGKRFPDVAQCTSAGRSPAEAVNPILLRFLASRGIDAAGATTRSVESLQLSLATFDIVIGLEGRVKDYIPRLPFHTSALDWSLPACPPGLGDEETTARLEEVYRVLVSEIDGLMHTLVGDNGD